ncbi:SU10 major capsid protein [Amycolatopsis rubida]|uniref:Uncharacterized protein n=1 Tax=Amycolatopsis rubida TaxID=112413 RepID=A0A1I5IHI9_9PSEU|nr:DUF5309 family protein [Amycolatopsis rubida]SFO59882.1 hypothetical protein SAMN05421854_102467 [Amycolatopsis rubida]
MSGITALGTTYNLPNYSGILYQLTPADVPFFSAIGGLSGGGGQAADYEFEWETFDLRDAAQNTVLEGADAPTEQNRVRANATNILQIHQETVGVSYTKQAANQRKSGLNNDQSNPVANELDWQTEQMLKQMVRDINWSFINGVYQKPSDNTTARKTRGLLSAIASNVTDAAGGVTATGTAAASTDLITLTTHGLAAGDTVTFSSVGTATPLIAGQAYYVLAAGLTANDFKVSRTKGGVPVDITANGTVIWSKGVALTKTMVDDTLQMAYDNGGLTEQATATLLCGSAQKRAITNAYVTAGNYVRKELVGNVGGVTVDRIDTDFGTLNVMLDRAMSQSTVAVVSMEQCSPVYLDIPGKGHFFQEPLAKTGAKDRNQIYGEVGLKYGNERAHAKILNLK